MNAHTQRFNSQLNQNLVDHDNNIVEGTRGAAQQINLVILYYAIHVAKRIGLPSSLISDIAQHIRLSLNIPVLNVVGEDPLERAARTVQAFGLAPAEQIWELIAAKAPAAARAVKLQLERDSMAQLSALFREHQKGFEIAEFFAGTPIDLLIADESEQAAQRHKLDSDLIEIIVAATYLSLLSFADRVLGVAPARRIRFLAELADLIFDPRQRMLVRNTVSRVARQAAIRIRTATNQHDTTSDDF